MIDRLLEILTNVFGGQESGGSFDDKRDYYIQKFRNMNSKELRSYLRDTVDEKTDQLSELLSPVRERITEINTRLDQIETRLDELELDINEAEKESDRNSLAKEIQRNEQNRERFRNKKERLKIQEDICTGAIERLKTLASGMYPIEQEDIRVYLAELFANIETGDSVTEEFQQSIHLLNERVDEWIKDVEREREYADEHTEDFFEEEELEDVKDRYIESEEPEEQEEKEERKKEEEQTASKDVEPEAKSGSEPEKSNAIESQNIEENTDEREGRKETN